MRTYSATGYRVSGDGSIEIEGRWGRMRWIGPIAAIALVIVTLIGSRMLALPVVAIALYLLVLPPRRRVVFDAGARVVRIEHAGAWSEKRRPLITFAEIEGIEIAQVAWMGTDAKALVVRVEGDRLYLISLARRADAEAIVGRARALLGLPVA